MKCLVVSSEHSHGDWGWMGGGGLHPHDRRVNVPICAYRVEIVKVKSNPLGERHWKCDDRLVVFLMCDLLTTLKCAVS